MKLRQRGCLMVVLLVIAGMLHPEYPGHFIFVCILLGSLGFVISE